MPYAEDIYEDLDDSYDEDIDDALGEDDLSERRRKRRGRKTRGRGYVQPRVERGAVSHLEHQAAAARIGQDIRTLNSDVHSVEARLERQRQQTAQSSQLMMLLPLLTKKSVTTSEAIAGIPANTKVLIDDGDVLTLMLPLL